MHQSVMDFVAEQVNEYSLANKRTLEVGSRNVNGSVRSLFSGDYVGVDLVSGPGVDICCPAADLPFEDGEFEVVVSTEMLEHDLTFWLSLGEMVRVLGSGGFFVLTTRGNGFPKHDWPADHYRFSTDAISGLFRFFGVVPLVVVEDDPSSPGVLAVGRKS